MHGLLYLYLLVYLALTLLGSVIMKRVSTAAGFGLGAFLIGSIVGSLPSLSRYTPTGLFTASSDMVNGREPVGDLATVLASMVLILVLHLVTVRVFKRQAL